MTVGPIEPLGSATWPAAVPAAEAPGRASFGDLVLQGIERLEQTQDTASGLAVEAATGDLENLHDYTIAASEAAVTTQLTVAVRNRAVEAFTEIMRMPIG